VLVVLVLFVVVVLAGAYLPTAAAAAAELRLVWVLGWWLNWLHTSVLALAGLWLRPNLSMSCTPLVSHFHCWLLLTRAPSSFASLRLSQPPQIQSLKVSPRQINPC